MTCDVYNPDTLSYDNHDGNGNNDDNNTKYNKDNIKQQFKKDVSYKIEYIQITIRQGNIRLDFYNWKFGINLFTF